MPRVSARERTAKRFQLLWPIVIVLLFSSSVLSQEQISRPGVYSGYSGMLYSEVLHNFQYIIVRDGANLAATIYWPAIDGKTVEMPCPVIWEGTTSRGRRNSDGSIQLSAESSGGTGLGPPRSLLDIVKCGNLKRVLLGCFWRQNPESPPSILEIFLNIEKCIGLYRLLD